MWKKLINGFRLPTKLRHFDDEPEVRTGFEADNPFPKNINWVMLIFGWACLIFWSLVWLNALLEKIVGYQVFPWMYR